MALGNLQARRLETSQFTLKLTRFKLAVQATNQRQMKLSCSAELLPMIQKHAT